MSGTDAFRTSIQCQMISAMLGQLRAAYRGDQKALAERGVEADFFRNKLGQLERESAAAARAASVQKFMGETVELRVGTSEGKVAGWASTPDLDYAGDRVQNGAFTASIARRGLTGPTAIKLLLDHDSTKPAGVITLLEYRSRGLWIEADLDLSIGYVRERYSVMKLLKGFNFSVAFRIEDYSNERSYRSITKGDLYEVSLVTFPCNEAATASVKSGSTLHDLLNQIQTLNRAMRT